MKVKTRFTSSIVPTDVITTAALKLHCRVDHDDEDTLIESLRLAAIGKVQSMTGKMLDLVGVEFYMDEIADVHLPWAPLATVTSVGIKQSDGSYTNMSGGYYYDTIANSPSLEFSTFPSLLADGFNHVKITGTVGYDASAGETPAALIQAVSLLVEHWYQFRGQGSVVNVNSIPMGVESLISEHRNVYFTP